MSHGHDVVITGIGSILPGANSAETMWDRLHSGISQITEIRSAEVTTGAPHYAAQVSGFDHTQHLPSLPEKFAQRYTRDILMGMAAAEQAMIDADLAPGTTDYDPCRLGIVASSSRGPVEWWTTSNNGPNAVLGSLPGTAATMTAVRLKAKGFVTTLSNACVGGHQAVSLASTLLSTGQTDIMLVLGHETPLTPRIFDLYTAKGSKVLASAVGKPSSVIKPYDARRDGFALGEGAVALVLERASHAAARRARPMAQVLSVRSINEADHATRMDLSGETTAHMMERATYEKGISPKDIGYVCGHGTATRYNDLSESRAMRHVYGHGDAPPLGSIKPIFGHLLGASGVLNCAAITMMLDRKTLVPTINCEEVDPDCAHDHVVEGPRPTSLHHAMSLSFAIGSQSSALVLASC